MKNLHLIPNGQFAESYIDFINTNFDSREHLFFLLGKDFNTKINLRNNIKKINKKDWISLLLLVKESYVSEKIFLHGLFSNLIIFLLFIQPWLLRKSNWIIWGGDLYWYKNRKKTFITDLIETMRRSIIPKIREISYITKGDYELAKEWYKVQAIPKKAIYQATFYNEISKVESVYKRKNVINIQVGNSATESNNHLNIFKDLAKFKNENIRIYCPLSYGDVEYRNRVIDYGNEIFGQKFIPLIDYMEKKDYFKYLRTIDIGLFNYQRQQGMGNISLLIFFGKKVFIRKDTGLWKHYKEEFNISLYDIRDIKSLSYIDFIYQNKNEAKENQHKILPIYQIEYGVQIWQENFKK